MCVNLCDYIRGGVSSGGVSSGVSSGGVNSGVHGDLGGCTCGITYIFLIGLLIFSSYLTSALSCLYLLMIHL